MSVVLRILAEEIWRGKALGKGETHVELDKQEADNPERRRERFEQDCSLSTIGQLAAGLAHEINNPLTTIKGFISLLSGAPAEKWERYFCVLNHEIMRIEQVTQELMALASPHVEVRKLCDLADLIDRAGQSVHDYANACGVLLCRTHLSRPLFVCDDQQLLQVLINLLENAIEAMPEGGTVTTTLSADRDHAYITICDEGVGVPEEIRSQVGTPFFSTKENGIGLGLLICRRIIDQYEGDLIIEKAPERGTRVTVVLPVAK